MTFFSRRSPSGRQRIVGSRRGGLLSRAVGPGFQGPSVIELTLDLRQPTNNPVKNLLSAAVILYIRNPNRLRRRETRWTPLSHNAQSGKHFYRLPRISTQVPAGTDSQALAP